jgi:hypothetical protein
MTTGGGDLPAIRGQIRTGRLGDLDEKRSAYDSRGAPHGMVRFARGPTDDLNGREDMCREHDRLGAWGLLIDAPWRSYRLQPDHAQARRGRRTTYLRGRRLRRGNAGGGDQRIGTRTTLARCGEPPQALGRTRERDRAGRTGKAGRSRAGRRLTGFFIGRVLRDDTASMIAMFYRQAEYNKPCKPVKHY